MANKRKTLRTIRYRFLFLGFLLLFMNFRIQAQFIEIGSTLPMGRYYWADYDNDGDLDVTIAVPTGTVKIFKNDGTGLLTDANVAVNGVAPNDNFPTINFGASVFWFDADNDGQLELLLNTTSETNIYELRSDGDVEIAKKLNESSTLVGSGDYLSFDAGDFDNDGDLDLIFSGGTSTVSDTKILRNDGSFTFTALTNMETKITFPTTIFSGTIIWGDYDGDDDLDILLTGATTNDGAGFPSNSMTKIYTNNGDATFSELSVTIDGVSSTNSGAHNASWADYDRDGDLDILISGNSSPTTKFTKIYVNDGNGGFTDNGANLEEIATQWGDYDNDGDLDILGNTVIYQNNGSGLFTQIDRNLPSVQSHVDITVLDYNNDGLLDIAGIGSPNLLIFRGISTQVNTAPPSVPNNLKATIQGDSVLLSWDKSTDAITPQNGLTYNVYIGTAPLKEDETVSESVSSPANLNYGFRKVLRMGNAQNKNSFKIEGFPEPASQQVYYWSVQAIDGTGRASFFAQEVSFTYEKKPTVPTSLSTDVTKGRLLVDWSGGFSKNKYIVYRSTASGSGFAIVDTVSDQTLSDNTFYIEDNTQITDGTQYYYKIQSLNDRGVSALSAETSATADFGIFSLVKAANLTGLRGEGLSWGDYDNDGDLDLFVMGLGRLPNSLFTDAILYINQGGNNFERSPATFPVLLGGDAAWADYNGDGHLDLIVTGTLGSIPTTRLLKNNGSGGFDDSGISNLPQVDSSAVAWADYDNDGDLDLAIFGVNSSDVLETKIYRNQGDGTFEDSGISNLTPLKNGKISWGDYDNDGDLDLLMGGFGLDNIPTIKIFTNNGDNTFSDVFPSNGFVFTSGGFGDVQWGDYDNDGDLDVLTSGIQAFGNPGTVLVTLFQNNEGLPGIGGRTFDEVTTSFTGVKGVARWGDYDNDGDLDILVNGGTPAQETFDNGVTQLYVNNGDGTFSEDNNFTLFQITGGNTQNNGQVNWADYDNDGDLDFVVTGDISGEQFSSIYRNESSPKNTVPTTPANLSAVVSNDTVTLAWDKATDAQTTQNALTYNLRIGTTPGGDDLVPSMAIASTGLRKIVQRGFQNNQKVLKGLAPAIYYWSVQALDHSFAGSAFAAEGSFRIVTAPSIPNDLAANALSSSTIALTWSSSSSADNFSSYIIERSDGNNSNFQPIDTVTSDLNEYESQNLNENTTYFYRIRVVNTAGEGLSNEASSTTNNLPRAPEDIIATAVSITQIDLTWTDVAISEDGFIIQRKSLLTNNEYETIDSVKTPNSTSYSDTQGLIGNVEYTYRLQTYNANGQSVDSDEASATTPIDASVALPPKPLNFFANPFSPSQISLEWTYTSTAANTFVIDRSPATDSSNYQQIAEIPAQTLRTYNDTTNLVENQIYYYRIRAKNSGGFSDFSDITLARAECNLPIFVSLAEGQVNQVCLGQGAKIEVTADLFQPSYQWLRNGVRIPSANAQFYVAYQTGEYTCEVSSGVCTQITKSAVVVVVKDPLTVSISSENGALAPSIANAETYTWYLDFEPIAGATGPSYTPEVNGKYYLVIEKDGCSATSNIIDLATITGIAENNLSRAITLSPNPVNQEVEIKIHSPLMGKYQLWLINAQGQRFSLIHGIKTKAVLKERLQLQHYPAGVYQVLVELAQQKGVTKLVKQ